jgi:hypothetical protein
MKTGDGFWVKASSFWLYISENIGTSIEMYPCQNRSAISMLCRIYEGNEGIRISPHHEIDDLMPEEARVQASILLEAAVIADNWKMYQEMVKGSKRFR